MSAAGFFPRRVRSLHGGMRGSVCGGGVGVLKADESAETSEDNLGLRDTVENCSDLYTVWFLGMAGELVDVLASAEESMECNRV
jgi:hypothetical protein